MAFKVHTFSVIESFLETATPFLEEHEAFNSLPLGIALRIAEKPGWYQYPPFLALVKTPSQLWPWGH